MWGRRITYLGILLGCFIFYAFYREWFSWFLLVAVIVLPWFSLLISLPAMLTVKADLRCPERARQDMPVRTALRLKSVLPTPPVLCTIRLVNSLTGERYLGEPGEMIPTEHCGLITITYPKMCVYDYLGLFRRRLQSTQSCTIFIEPRLVATERPVQPSGTGVGLWKPKPGGGYSEVHDLRLYRPGDELRHIHWKMSLKTGNLIYREPMEPVLKGYMLNLELTGTAEQLDKKLGRLSYVSQSLLDRGLTHTVRCMHGGGVSTYRISDASSWERCLHDLLSMPCAKEGMLENAENVIWQHRIGGDSNEA